jgi:hypothetical protein
MPERREFFFQQLLIKRIKRSCRIEELLYFGFLVSIIEYILTVIAKQKPEIYGPAFYRNQGFFAQVYRAAAYLFCCKRGC